MVGPGWSARACKPLKGCEAEACSGRLWPVLVLSRGCGCGAVVAQLTLLGVGWQQGSKVAGSGTHAGRRSRGAQNNRRTKGQNECRPNRSPAMVISPPRPDTFTACEPADVSRRC
eukprot:scaffold16407_cov127-Isochrysis_galbana.AAC.3